MIIEVNQIFIQYTSNEFNPLVPSCNKSARIA